MSLLRSFIKHWKDQVRYHFLNWSSFWLKLLLFREKRPDTTITYPSKEGKSVPNSKTWKKSFPFPFGGNTLRSETIVNTFGLFLLTNQRVMNKLLRPNLFVRLWIGKFCKCFPTSYAKPVPPFSDLTWECKDWVSLWFSVFPKVPVR